MNISEIEIAEVCHTVNKAYCESIGDPSQVPWRDAHEWQRKSALNGVRAILQDPDAPPSVQHDNWLAEKMADGWMYGVIKDVDRKKHPCCIPYDQLDDEQKSKDYIFKAVAIALAQAGGA